MIHLTTWGEQPIGPGLTRWGWWEDGRMVDGKYVEDERTGWHVIRSATPDSYLGNRYPGQAWHESLCGLGEPDEGVRRWCPEGTDLMIDGSEPTTDEQCPECRARMEEMA